MQETAHVTGFSESLTCFLSERVHKLNSTAILVSAAIRIPHSAFHILHSTFLWSVKKCGWIPPACSSWWSNLYCKKSLGTFPTTLHITAQQMDPRCSHPHNLVLLLQGSKSLWWLKTQLLTMYTSMPCLLLFITLVHSTLHSAVAFLLHHAPTF